MLRALGLGDLLTALPALRGLRRALPGHRLVLATPGWLAPLVAATGAVDEHLAHDGLGAALPVAAPDVAANLHGRGPQSTALLAATRPGRLLAHAADGVAGPVWRDDAPERERWCDLLAWHGVPADPADVALGPPGVPSPAPGAVLVHPGAAFGSKRWPADRFAAVARELGAQGRDVRVTGSAAEEPLARAVAGTAGLPDGAVLAGRTGLAELSALVHGASAVVCGDTGIAHLATAHRTPSVVLFGPVPAARWGPPPGGPHRTLSADAARRGDPFAADPDPALLGVGVPEVLAAVAAVVLSSG